MKINKFKKPFKYVLLLSIAAVSVFICFLFSMHKSPVNASNNNTKSYYVDAQSEPFSAASKIPKEHHVKIMEEISGPAVIPTVSPAVDPTINPTLKPAANPAVKDSVPSSSKPILKTVCLTFDDGPSIETTPKILDILDRYQIKATFFVIGSNALKYSDILKRTYASGHVIGNHTFSHDINYFSIQPRNMVDDFYKGEAAIKTILPNYNLKLARIPGGSLRWNVSYRNAVKAAGFHAVDWNCLTRDAEGINVPSKTLFENVKRTAVKQQNLIILMHDSAGKETTLESLPEIIDYLKTQGFVFKVLN